MKNKEPDNKLDSLTGFSQTRFNLICRFYWKYKHTKLWIYHEPKVSKWESEKLVKKQLINKRFCSKNKQQTMKLGSILLEDFYFI